MKKIFYFLMLSVFAFGFTACGGETEEATNEDAVIEDVVDQEVVAEVPVLLGSWLKSDDSGEETYTFNADNTLVVNVSPSGEEGFVRNATWSQADGSLTLKFDNMEEEQILAFTIEASNLNLTFNQATEPELTQTFAKQ